MEFMGVSIGVLALVCALVLLFGAHGARKILGWTLGLVIFGGVGVGAVIWGWPMLQQGPAPQKLTFDDIPNATVTTATPLTILPALPPGFVLDKTADVADKIQVTGPDKRIFLFAAGTERTAIQSYMQAQYGAPGTPRAACWAKEPGPWCDYR
jgi:hypothetical protein